MLLEIGVDAVGVRPEPAAGFRRQDRQLLLGDTAPTERAQEGVPLDLVLAEQHGEAAGGDVPANIHLPEAVLRVHIALRGEQVLSGVGVQLRDAVPIAANGNVRVERGDRLLSFVRGEGAAHRPRGVRRQPDHDDAQRRRQDDGDDEHAAHEPQLGSSAAAWCFTMIGIPRRS